MARYESYTEARLNGGRDVWPGCGERGRCMPCGGLNDRYVCYQYDWNDCPTPRPEPRHACRDGACERCGEPC